MLPLPCPSNSPARHPAPSSNKLLPDRGLIPVHIPSPTEIISLTYVASQYAEVLPTLKLLVPDEREKIFESLRETHRKKMIEEMSREQIAALEKVRQEIESYLLILGKLNSKEAIVQCSKMETSLKCLGAALIYDFDGTLLKSLEDCSERDVFDFAAEAFNYADLLNKWALTPVAESISSKWSRRSSGTASTSQSNQTTGLPNASPASNTTGKSGNKKEKNSKKWGKGIGEWGTRDSFQVLTNQGAISQLEHSTDTNLPLDSYSPEFQKAVEESVSELAMSTEKMVKSIGLQASPFIAKKVIKALLGISDQSPDGGAPGFLRHPGWEFISKLEGARMEDHLSNIGDFNLRNGIIASARFNSLMDDHKLSFVSLTPDHPTEVLTQLDYLPVPHDYEATEALILEGYSIGRILTMKNFSQFNKSNQYPLVADREDLPDPVNMAFHHRCCLIHSFIAAAEVQDLEMEEEERRRLLNRMKVNEWREGVLGLEKDADVSAESTSGGQPNVSGIREGQLRRQEV